MPSLNAPELPEPATVQYASHSGWQKGMAQVMSSRRPLELLEIPTPCPASWNDMTGDARGRFCQHCQKTVHDLSAMPRDEAERLVCQSAGSLCIRLTRLPGGQVLTLDYPAVTPRRGWTWRVWSVVGLAGALITGVVNAALFGGRVFPSPRAFTGTVVVGNLPAWRAPSGPYAPNFVPSPSPADAFDLSCTPSASSPPPSANQ
jgi:hypothetical protein